MHGMNDLHFMQYIILPCSNVVARIERCRPAMKRE